MFDNVKIGDYNTLQIGTLVRNTFTELTDSLILDPPQSIELSILNNVKMSNMVFTSEGVTWSLLVWGLMVCRRELAATWGMSHHSDLCPDCDTIEPPPHPTASAMGMVMFQLSAQNILMRY